MNFKKTNKILSASLAGLLIIPGCCQAKKGGVLKITLKSLT